ncbi:DUF3105 domain-containing protein [Iamia majanohamensis]|uniref:DUF3105 domain-containing protein n=1 Tax=Iamia majanohamensis TaxID=467976 RepID=A0AAF0BXK7_9ACTN|nr:DUF3105 domain-containing protein [Iamia majanohamensis]WCO69053.1 DUF3105 domain-containing protein [Iamia majanohamensis]
MAAPSLPAPRRAVALAAVVALLVGAGACGGDGGAAGPCGAVQREPLDQRVVHVLPGAPAPEYRTDPPTSGPHTPSPVTEAVRDEPVPAPIQVGILEEGRVLLQHHGLSDPERAEVEGLAGDAVVVAPAEALPDGAAVVATAWVSKQVCDGVDVDVLGTFVDDHRGGGPGGHS